MNSSSKSSFLFLLAPSAVLITDFMRRGFCLVHERDVYFCEKPRFQFHRDIIHAAFLPLLQILNEASCVASCSLPGRPPADLELAFRGDARSAYSWLQSVVSEDRDWCLTKGCPTCVVLHVFHSEPLIRLMAVACRISEYMKTVGLVKSHCQLPSFNFWLRALKLAVRQDPFWGDRFWKGIKIRTTQLEIGMRQLIEQCFELRDSRFVAVRRPLYSGLLDGGSGTQQHSNVIDVKASAWARRQQAMKWEEQIQLSQLISGGSTPTRREEGNGRMRPRRMRTAILAP